MIVIKRDGRVVDFDESKIRNAMISAFRATRDSEITKNYNNLINSIIEKVKSMENEELTVEDIQDIVEQELIHSEDFTDIAKEYILYRKERDNARKNTLDETIDEIIMNTSDYWSNENSNKDSRLVTTQRDYIAGAVSTDKGRRTILPKSIVELHDKGVIHVHDMDYIVQPLHNCDLINLEDMLQNGTIISNTLIEKPHRFSTACNIATQIIAQVASSQFGGQSIGLSHLSPFVEESRKYYSNEKLGLDKDEIEKFVKLDIANGIQTLQYQILTLD